MYISFKNNKYGVFMRCQQQKTGSSVKKEEESFDWRKGGEDERRRVVGIK